MGQSPSEIRAEIAQERAQLGETVKALAEKADVKARVQRKAADSAGQLGFQAGQVVGQAQQKAEEVGAKVRQITPDPVMSGVESATTAVRKRPVPVGALAALAIVAVVVTWRHRRGS